LRQAESGDGRVIEDNTTTIDGMLDDYNATVPSARRSHDSDSGGCAVSNRSTSGAPWAALGLGLLALVYRRNRKLA
jgi:MYXO-CTERM domain-containing protein